MSTGLYHDIFASRYRGDYRTRHREAAPNQYEYAPYFGLASVQIDENIILMELIEAIAKKHRLAALLHEKPIKGVNGSGPVDNICKIYKIYKIFKIYRIYKI